MATEVDIANRALSILGEARITSLTDSNKAARAMNARFDLLRDAELAAYPWRFAIKRVQLTNKIPLTVPNGTFDTDTVWSKATGWTIGSGTANASAPAGDGIYQSILGAGKYEVLFDVVSYTSGSVSAWAGGSEGRGANASYSAVGSYSIEINAAGGNGNLVIGSAAGFVGSIDNVTVNVLPAWGYSKAYARPPDDLQPRKVGGYFVNAEAIGAMYESSGVATEEAPYEIIANQIHTNLSAPLDYEYTAQITDTTEFHTLFVESLAARLAADAAEELTQSNTKQQSALFVYKKALNEARRVNAIMRPPRRRTVGRWMASRIVG